MKHSVLHKATKALVASAGLAVAMLGTSALAGDYPTKAITLVAPYGPGGASDLAARTLSSVAPSYIGQPVMVVNRTGAGGAVGSAIVNKSRPDGYKLLLARIGSQAVSPAMKANMPYAYDDFTMLGLLELNPVLCATSADKPYQTFGDLIDAVNANPGTLSYASSGIGTLLHLAVPFALDAAGVENATDAIRHVPYKGGGAAVTAVVGGQVDVVCTNAPALASHIEAGTVRPLVVTTASRISMAPDTPTAAELGFPEMEVLVGWSALYGPPNMDAETVAVLENMLAQVAEDKAWNKFTKALGSIPQIRSSADTKAFVDAQVAAFSAVVEKLGMKIE